MGIELGDKVKDTISGFTGIAVAITKWIHGCDRISVQPQGVKPDGQLYEMNNFDVLQLEIVKKGVVKSSNTAPEPIRAKATGGPRDDKSLARRPDVAKRRL